MFRLHGCQWTTYQKRGSRMHRECPERFPVTDFEGSRYLAILACITALLNARAVINVGIGNPRWRGKRSRHSQRMFNPQFYVFDKRPMFTPSSYVILSR